MKIEAILRGIVKSIEFGKTIISVIRETRIFAIWVRKAMSLVNKSSSRAWSARLRSAMR